MANGSHELCFPVHIGYELNGFRMPADAIRRVASGNDETVKFAQVDVAVL
jgi:hypothetical protein